ncbi:MAG: hypothetical protein ACOYEW_09140 [Anaerolineae bacterium]
MTDRPAVLSSVSYHETRPTPPQPNRPGGEETFGAHLQTANSAYRRKMEQTGYLRCAAYAPGQAGRQSVVDEEWRRLVLANAAAGFTVPAPGIGCPPPTAAPASPPVASVASASATPSLSPMSLASFPRPVGDNGRGVHWVPTLRSDPETVDRFVAEAAKMGMKWVVFLNDGTNIGDNDYLVRKLTEHGIMPVLRVFTDGLSPIEGDLQAMVRHYRDLGVSYFQLYNEPNLMVETHGQPPDVKRYLDLWIPAAREVIAAGGLPGIGALSPQGEMDDREFLRQMLDELDRRGELVLLDRTWLAVHNYTGPRTLSDPDGFLRFRQYDEIVRAKLGRSLPMVGTEGGTHVSPHVDEEAQVQMVLGAYDYMAKQPEPYNFAYTYWIIANEAGGGKDPEFSHHALYRPDGPTKLARALAARA